MYKPAQDRSPAAPETPHNLQPILRLLLSSAPSDPTQAALDRFLRRHPKLEGTRILQFLLRHPEQSFSAGQLEMLLNPPSGQRAGSGPGQSDALLYEAPLPYCDTRTLFEVRSRLKQLQRLQAGPETPENPAGLALEIAALHKYLQECVAPGGKIRSFERSSRRSYKRLYARLHCLLRHCAREDPALQGYLLAHLQTGKEFCWSRELEVESGK